MGLIQSTHEESEEGGEPEEDEAAAAAAGLLQQQEGKQSRKVLEQEPEVLPCHPSASPLSPQLSCSGTPYLGSSVRVWDPYHVLSQSHFVPPAGNHHSLNTSALHHHHNGSDEFDGFEDELGVEVYLIHHAESTMDEKPDLIGGRCPSAILTPNGKRQARALAVFLNSQGLRFDEVYSSPLERAKHTALFVCQEMDILEEKIQCSDGLIEMSQGQWEGCHFSDIYTPEVVNIINRSQPDFCAPGGESERQVEFRMVEFLNNKVLQRSVKSTQMGFARYQNNTKVYGSHNSLMQVHPIEDGDGTTVSQWELFNGQKQLAKRKSGKSRLQFVTTGDNETEDELSPEDSNIHRQVQEKSRRHSECVGIFTHEMAIKCLLTGLLGSNPLMIQRICIDNSSMTVLRHSSKTGWKIERINDTAHLRLLYEKLFPH
ncbi:hypothetical protein SUGI_0949940 [Cryptomeria japonica]|uniref:uncharacterized protein LOC131077105 n=1 Tax=Cryptomeria japonica TaxID=3369 RepID=UPI00241493AF|nr:uncharacterized protein LOC131077105 [Cryptomeria japonica]GLJ45125.1 hypothetical protein SUGI_0949940 [Cryptomeria japonica]